MPHGPTIATPVVPATAVRLDAYRLAIEFHVIASAIARRLHQPLRDQLQAERQSDVTDARMLLSRVIRMLERLEMAMRTRASG